MQHRAAFFYADYGLVVSTDPVWLQRSFDTVTGLFDRVVLQIFFGNTVVIIFHHFFSAGNQSEAAYTFWMMGEGLM